MSSDAYPSMPQWLRQRALLTPDRIAMETAREQLSFKQLYARVRQAAAGLRDAGVRSGDPVASLQGNTLDCAVTVYALMLLGAVMVPLNTRLSPTELSGQIKQSGSRILVTDHDNAAAAEQAVTTMGCMIRDAAELAQTAALFDDQETEIELTDPCTIIFTSGTTGRPKGVVLTYGNHWWNANGSLINLGLQQSDTWLCCVPLFHVSGLSILMKSIIYGMPVYLMKKFNAAQVNQLLLSSKATHISVVASMLQRMSDGLGSGQAYPNTLRCILLGGGPVPASLLDRCLRLHMPIYQTYGMSETASQAATLPPEYMREKAGSAGKPLFPLQLQIATDGRRAAVHEPGEILIKGPTVFSHYLNNASATAAAMKNGWFHSGDIGYLDKDGFLFVLDRRKDLIISGGENIYPAEIESILHGCPGIARAGVIGIPDHKWGRVPVAFVCLKPGAAFSETKLIGACRAQLASYKVPRRIFVLDALPENAAHKLLRRKLYMYYEQLNQVK